MDIQELKRLAEACRNAKTSDEFLKVNNKYTRASHPGAILSLISRIEELEKAIKPFADFYPSLLEYYNDRFRIQDGWPEHKPVIVRHYPVDMYCRKTCQLDVHNFREASSAYQGGKND